MFPDPRGADEYGVVCVGGQINTPTLQAAYSSGIFPWPHQGYPLLWFSPDPRGILKLDNFHVGRRLRRELKSKNWTIGVDRQFERVIKGCQLSKRADQEGTWITGELSRGYVQFHRAGFAHSIEVLADGELIGGLYGVFVNGAMSAESMFFLESSASKAAVIALVHMLNEIELEWLDIQMITPITESFGGHEEDREWFLSQIAQPAKMDEPTFAQKLRSFDGISLIETLPGHVGT